MKSVLKLIEIKAQELTPLERVVCLSVDDVYLKCDISYDPKDDCFVGPHSKANTMLMRGLFKKYKIPVWWRYDTPLSKNELFEIIGALE